MSKQNSPAWGAPVSTSWGSPLSSNVNRSGASSPSQTQTPVRPERDNFPSHLNRSNSHPYRAPHHSNSPTGGNFNYNSPRHFTPRPRYQSSPLNNSGGGQTPRFNRHNSSQEFTPSPRFHHQNNSRFTYQNRRSFSQNDRSSNPGGSNNINDYIHPSMLEDPWKDLKPTPLLRQY